MLLTCLLDLFDKCVLGVFLHVLADTLSSVSYCSLPTGIREKNVFDSLGGCDHLVVVNSILWLEYLRSYLFLIHIRDDLSLRSSSPER